MLAPHVRVDANIELARLVPSVGGPRHGASVRPHLFDRYWYDRDTVLVELTTMPLCTLFDSRQLVNSRD